MRLVLTQYRTVRKPPGPIGPCCTQASGRLDCLTYPQLLLLRKVKGMVTKICTYPLQGPGWTWHRAVRAPQIQGAVTKRPTRHSWSLMGYFRASVPLISWGPSCCQRQEQSPPVHLRRAKCTSAPFPSEFHPFAWTAGMDYRQLAVFSSYEVPPITKPRLCVNFERPQSVLSELLESLALVRADIPWQPL